MFSFNKYNNNSHLPRRPIEPQVRRWRYRQTLIFHLHRRRRSRENSRLISVQSRAGHRWIRKISSSEWKFDEITDREELGSKLSLTHILTRLLMRLIKFESQVCLSKFHMRYPWVDGGVVALTTEIHSMERTQEKWYALEFRRNKLQLGIQLKLSFTQI